MKEAGDHKQQWYEHMKDKGLRVKLAIDDNNLPCGMIQYVPIEHSMFEGENLYVILCIWVHGHKKGQGNQQHKGIGSELLKAAEQDCRQLGTNGMTAWGLIIPVFMRASWFKRKGYKVADKRGMMRLLWKPLKDEALAPRFMNRIKTPAKAEDKVSIDIFCNGWCPVQNMGYERVKRAAQEFPQQTVINEYFTTNRNIVKEWGIFDSLYIDGKEIQLGPPPSYLKIKKKVKRAVKKKNLL
jgi:N-acetylglutamate synthase and related acetyltransferases